MYSNSLESLSSRIVFFSSCVSGLGWVFIYIYIWVFCVYIYVGIVDVLLYNVVILMCWGIMGIYGCFVCLFWSRGDR